MSPTNTLAENCMLLLRGDLITTRQRLSQFTRGLVRIGIVLVFLPIFALSLYGQQFSGSVVGTITDQSGAAMAGASVTLTNVGTGVEQKVTSGETGAYQFLNLIPGTYRAEVAAKGFKSITRTNIVVSVAGTTQVNMRMEVGAETQTVEVHASTPLLQTQEANLSQVVNSQLVSQLPLNGRNIMNLTAIVPGVVPQGTTSGQALTGKNIFAAGNYQIGGGMANQSATYLDGVPANSALGNLVNFVPDPDAVSEFRVQTSSNSAEYGRYSGGVINSSTKSGTNDFHGDVFEYVENTVFNANDFFANKTGAGKAPYHLNQYGASVGGPIKKNKMFFFFNWENYHAGKGATWLTSVPLPEMYQGNFTNLLDNNGKQIPIYDPLTQCGTGGNPACVAGQPQRKQFSYNGVLNIIPPNRINPVMAKLFAYPWFAVPNGNGSQYTHVNNYSSLCSIGGKNNQENGRYDYSVSSNMRLFARYSRWSSAATPCAPYHNGSYANDPYSPEQFTTTQAVLGMTDTLSSSTVLDVHLAYNRFPYNRVESNAGINLHDTFGFPAYMDTLLPIIHSGPGTGIPAFTFSGYGFGGRDSGLHILSNEDDYFFNSDLAWVRGRHTFKFGIDFRQLMNGYYQTFDGGSFNFDNLITSVNALSPGKSGNSLASALLGYGSGGNVTAFSRPWDILDYQGYYAQDTWQATPKLTATFGVRWEIPGVWKEEHNRIGVFNPSELNPVLQKAGITVPPITLSDGSVVPSHAVYGALDFVNTPQIPSRGAQAEHFGLFAPRLGIAYRLNDKTVVRAGGGIYYLPSNTEFAGGPWAISLNQLGTTWAASNDGGITPNFPISDPFPNGMNIAPGNLPHDQAQAIELGGGISSQKHDSPYPYQEQWNVALQRELGSNTSIQVAYAGSTGVHLPFFSLAKNILPAKYLSQGASLFKQVSNPFYGVIKTGTLSAPKVTAGRLLLPYPEYTGVTTSQPDEGTSTYHALNLTFQKRFNQGGTLLVGYSFSKLLADSGTSTGWLDSTWASGTTTQNPLNLSAEKALSNFDVRQRLTVAYSLNLPFGQGQRFLSGGTALVQKFISGWRVNGVTTYQEGLPLALSASPNNAGSFGFGLRPNVIPGCNKKVSGSDESRLNNWFNTSCFTVPAPFTLGNEPATDPTLRGPGIANYDFSLIKVTPITERINFVFRAEAYNIFNRPQFAVPNTGISPSNIGTGVIGFQVNNPREIQLSARISF